MKNEQTISPERQKDLRKLANAISSLVKTVMGVANNAAWMACLEALDKAKTHPRYRKRSRDGKSIKWLFKRAVEAHKAYERTLLYGGPPYFFRLNDLPPAARKAFGDISDADYYDLWTAIGAKTYEKSRTFVTCLANKFRVSMEQHGIENADICSWITTATTCLKIAVRVYESALRSAGKTAGNLSVSDLDKVFHPFSLDVVLKLWMEAEFALEPAIDIDIDDPVEKKNLLLSIQQVEEQWMSFESMYGSAAEVFDQYDDVWRTPGEQKKSISNVLELMRNCEEEGERRL